MTLGHTLFSPFEELRTDKQGEGAVGVCEGSSWKDSGRSPVWGMLPAKLGASETHSQWRSSEGNGPGATSVQQTCCSQAQAARLCL